MPFRLKGAPATFQRALDIILSGVRWQICLVYLDDVIVRSFLGACNVYRRFVKGFSKIARPLTDITRKDSDHDFDNPTKVQLQAFESLKAAMISPPILALPRYGRPYLLDTDASAYQLGCTLLQEHDEPNDWPPVGYWSYSLSDSERNYSATERECFAVVWAVRTLRPYIEGTKFTVRTDHDALRWLMSLTESSGRLTRWRLRLAE
ncbi:Ribonuclease H (fragment) [Chondrus crispus]|uniref:Ribonuclease H n=1 Tax=Chondrus crispus TaxID=2769 RepID=R7QPD1_CHOCR